MNDDERLKEIEAQHATYWLDSHRAGPDESKWRTFVRDDVPWLCRRLRAALAVVEAARAERDPKLDIPGLGAALDRALAAFDAARGQEGKETT